MPVIGVAAADRPDPGRYAWSPQEGVLPDALAGNRVVAVAFGLGAERRIIWLWQTVQPSRM